MKLRTVVFALLLPSVILCLVSVAAAERAAEKAEIRKRPKIGLVFAGGGALGFAHIGIVKVLEENRIPIDYVAGTSMGSIVAAGVGVGKTSEEMLEFAKSVNWDEFFIDGTGRADLPYHLKSGRDREILADGKFGVKDGEFNAPVGLIRGQKVLPAFQRFYGSGYMPEDFDRLPVPFRAMAGDIETGEAVELSSGDVALAARASMAVPGAFSPIEIDGRLLVDGGVVNNLPVQVTRDMGADVLVVVDLKEEYKKKKDLKSLLDITGQVLTMLLDQNSDEQIKLMQPQDILIVPDVRGFTAGDFAKHHELAERGERAAAEAIDRLQHLRLSEADYAEYRRGVLSRVPETKPVRLDFVRVENSYHLLDRVVRNTLSVSPGDEFDRDKVEKDISEINKLGYFSQVSYQVVEENGKKGLVITASEKEWARKFFRFGASIEDDFQGNSTYSLAVGLRVNGLNTWGGHSETTVEIGTFPRLFTEFYQPLGAGSPYFVAPALNLERKMIFIRYNDEIVAQYKRMRNWGGLRVGREIGSLGEISVGGQFGKGELDRYIGDPQLGEPEFDIGEVQSRLVLDTLDSPDFPRSGYKFDISMLNSIEDLGADDEYDQLSGMASVPLTWGLNTLLMSARYGVSFDSLPATRSYTLGGFLNISGYQRDSLLASDFVTGRLVYYRELFSAGSPLFGLALFGGGSLELSHIENDDAELADYNDLLSGSLFLGVDTAIAPVYFALGMAEEGEASGYFVLGRVRGN